MSLASTLMTETLAILRSASLKVGNQSVINILESADANSVSAQQCPLVTVEIVPTGVADQVTSDTWQGELAIQLGAFVAHSQPGITGARTRAIQLITDVQAALLSTASFGASVGSMTTGEWSGYEMIEDQDVVGIIADLTMTTYEVH